MYRTLVVGTDGSPTADKAVQTAAELARSWGSELHIVTAFRTPRSGMGAAAGVRPGRQRRGAGAGRGRCPGDRPGRHREVRGWASSAEAHGAQGNADDVILATAVGGGRGPDRRGEQGHARRPPLSRQRAELGGARRELRRADRQDRLDGRDRRRRRAWHSVLVRKNYFDAAIAETYDADSTFLFDPASSARRSTSWRSSPATAPPWSSASAPAASRCRCRSAACRCAGSTCRPTWWRS